MMANAPGGYRQGMNRVRPRWRAVLLTLGAALAASCASHTGEADPQAALNDPSSNTSQQRRAAQALAADVLEGRVAPAEGREALKRIVWRRSAPTPVRVVALEALLDQDPADTATMLGLMLPTETNWDMIAEIGRLAVERDWGELTPALVRSWSRPVVEPSDADRPERAALAGLYPTKTVEEAVFDVFASPTGTQGVGERTRLAAWALLQRLDTTGEITRTLLEADAGADAGDSLIADLRAGARALTVVPRSAEQLQWLRAMRRPAHAVFWTQAASVVARLDDEQQRGLALRHIPALVWASEHEPSWLSATTREHSEALAMALDGRRKHMRTDGVVDFNAAQETLTAWEKELVWGDLLLLRLADRAIADPVVRAALFAQAVRDRADTTTEHGGIIEAGADGFSARAFPPRPTQRVGDNRFTASEDMITASTESPFHYHFHAQRSRNAEFAGPGRGDLAYADRFGRACLVFTSVSDRALDADYYQPGGVRVDLGEIHQPDHEATR